MKRQVYQSETDNYIEMEVIAKVRYIGVSFGIDALTDGKVYDVIAIEDNMLRVVDDSGEDYLYSIAQPADLVEPEKLSGRWEIVEDTKEKELEKLIK